MMDQRGVEQRKRTLFSTERFWEATVLWGGAIIFGVALAFLLWIVFEDATPLADKLETVWRSMVIAGGLLTFLTVVWRGLIATRQADQQRDQLAALSEQIKQSEFASLSALFEKGVNLISSGDRLGNEAGVIILHQIAISKHSGMSTAAANILIRFTHSIKKDERPALYSIAHHYLDDIMKRVAKENEAIEAKGRSFQPNDTTKPERT